MLTYLIVCPLCFLAAFVDAIAGGGGLISIPAYMIAGVPVKASLGTSKVSSAISNLGAVGSFAQMGFIDWKKAVLSTVTAVTGCILGSFLALQLSEEVFRVLMLILVPLTAVYVLRSHALDTAARAPLPPLPTALWIAGISFVLGFYDGFYGPGSGTFMLLGLAVLAHLDLETASGLVKVSMLGNNVSGLLVFGLGGQLVLPLGLVAGLFGAAGGIAGARTFAKHGARSVKPLIVVVLVLFFVRMLTEIL